MNRTESSPVFLDRNLSVYLDLARFIAAMAVLLDHMKQFGLYPEDGFFSGYAHSAVIYFFVLSGLVIANSTAKGYDGKSYISARAARIYSVAIPALLLSFISKGIFSYGSGQFPDYLSQDVTWVNFLGPILFLNESWGLGAKVPWNGPYWSLCYEVWYYILFGCFVYYQGVARIYVLGLVCLIAGPAILLLMPIWLLGVRLSSLRNSCSLKRPVLVVIFFGSFFAGYFVINSGVDHCIKDYLHNNVPGFWRLGNSQRFVTDYILALCVAVNIFSARFLMGGNCFFSDRMVRYVSAIAAMTFSLYIYHFPLLNILKRMNIHVGQNEFSAIPVVIFVLMACFVFSLFTEKKYLILKQWIESKLT